MPVRPRCHCRQRHPGPLGHHRQAGRQRAPGPHRRYPPQATRPQACHPNQEVLQLVQGGRRDQVRHPTRGHHQGRQDLHQGPQDPAVSRHIVLHHRPVLIPDSSRPSDSSESATSDRSRSEGPRPRRSRSPSTRPSSSSTPRSERSPTPPTEPPRRPRGPRPKKRSLLFLTTIVYDDDSLGPAAGARGEQRGGLDDTFHGVVFFRCSCIRFGTSVGLGLWTRTAADEMQHGTGKVCRLAQIHIRAPYRSAGSRCQC